MKLFLRKFIVFTLCLELFIPTQFKLNSAHANDTIMKALGLTQSALGQFGQLNQQQMMMNAQNAQPIQSMMVQPVPLGQSEPLFNHYGCTTLQAQVQADLSICPENPGNINPQQLPMIAQMLATANYNADNYSRMLTPSNSRAIQPGALQNNPAMSKQGISCYDDAEENFKRVLQARVESLKEFQRDIDKMVDDFQTQSQETQNKIAEMDVLLNGGTDADYKNKVRADYLYVKAFQDPVCATFLPNDKLESTGKGKGYQGIRDLIFQTGEKSPIRPATMLARKNTGFYEKNIDKIADDLSRNINLNNPSKDEITAASQRLTTNTGLENLGSLKAGLSQLETERSNFMRNLENDILSMNPNPQQQELMKQVLNTPGNPKDLIRSFEINTKNECFNNIFKQQFPSSTEFANRLCAPGQDARTCKESQNSLKAVIEATLSDPNLPLEEKLARIKAEERKGLNAKRSFQTNKSFAVDNVQIGASQRLRASDFIGIIAKNCNNQYVNGMDRSTNISPQAVVKKIESAAVSAKKYRDSFNAKIKSTLKNRILFCPDRAADTGKNPMSCEGALDDQSANFCVKTASQCAANIQGCLQKADQQVQKVRDQQLSEVQKYNKNMQMLKSSMQGFMQNLGTNLQQKMAQKMMGNPGILQVEQFYRNNTNLETPLNVDMDFAQKKFLDGFDQNLALEDPQAYATQMKKNIDVYIKSLEKQNDEILKGSGPQSIASTKKRVLDNYKKEADFWNGMMDRCQGAFDAYNQQMAKAAEERNKANQELGEFCSQVQAYTSNPGPGCDDEAGDVIKAATKAGYAAGADANSIQILKQHQQLCKSEDSAINLQQLVNDPTLTKEEFCREAHVKKEFETECDKLIEDPSNDQIENNICFYEEMTSFYNDENKLTSEKKTLNFCDKTSPECKCTENQTDNNKKHTALNPDKAYILDEEKFCKIIGAKNLKSKYCNSSSTSKKFDEAFAQWIRIQAINNSTGEIRFANCHAQATGDHSIGKTAIDTLGMGMQQMMMINSMGQ